MFLYFAVFVLLVPLVRSSHCGGILQANPGKMRYLQYPDFPQVYENYLECTWTIEGVDSKCVCIEFDFFSVEYSSWCYYYDWVTVDAGDTAGPGTLGRFCGDLVCGGFLAGYNPFSRGEICANDNKMTIHFHTDFSVGRYGFRLKYYAGADTKCNSNSNGNSQVNANANAQGNANANAQGNANKNAQGNANTNAQGNANANAQGNANANAQGNANTNAQGNANENAQSNANENAQGNANENAQGNANTNAQGNANENAQGNANENAQGNANTNAEGNANENAQDNANANAQGLRKRWMGKGNGYGKRKGNGWRK